MAHAPDQFEREMIAALPKLRAAALVWTRDADAADDIVRATAERAWKHRDSFALGTNMAAWLCMIGRNGLYSEKRRSWRSVTMPMLTYENGDQVPLTDLLPTPANQQHSVELDEVLEAISYLPRPMAEAVLMIGEGLEYEEAAEELGVSVGTVKSRVSRGRAQLDAYFGLNLSRETT